MNRRVSVRVVGYSTTYAGTLEDCSLPVHLAMGRQTLVWAVEPAGACEPARASSLLQLGKTCSTPMGGERLCRNPAFRREIPAPPWRILGDKVRGLRCMKIFTDADVAFSFFFFF